MSGAEPPLASLRAQAAAQLRDGQWEDAVETFSACLALDLQDAASLQGRAMARFQLQQWAEAIADFRAAKARHPDDLENWVGLGMSLAMDHQVYPAIATFEELLAAHPDYVRGHLQLGLLYLQLGIIPKGRRQLEQALACRPSAPDRRLIESTLREQSKLDRKRYYRPDFDALARQRGQHPQAFTRLRGWLRRLFDAWGRTPMNVI